MNTKNLSDLVDETYQKLENNEHCNFTDIEGGVFLRKLIQDYQNFTQIIKENFVSKNRRGWIGNIPLCITIEIMNREEVPGKVVHVNLGYKRHLLVYYGICPELESFVNIVLWPTDETHNTSNRSYKNIYEMVTEDKDFKNIIVFGEGVEIEFINTIHPSRCKNITTIPKPKNVYDWQYIPFIKESGDTILSHTSPLNFKHVYMDELRKKSSYINPMVTIGRLSSFDKQNIEILIPTLLGKWLPYRARVSDGINSKLDKSWINTIRYFLIYESLDVNVQDIVVAVEPANAIDLLGHLVSFCLYTLRISNKTLYTLLLSEYEKIFRECFRITDNFCRRENSNYSGLWEPLNIFQAYLSQYFRIIGKSIYYVPLNQFQLSSEMLLIYDEALRTESESISKIVQSLGFTGKLTQLDHKLYDFIKLCNDLKRYLIWNQKRDLVSNKLKELF